MPLPPNSHHPQSVIIPNQASFSASGVRPDRPAFASCGRLVDSATLEPVLDVDSRLLRAIDRLEPRHFAWGRIPRLAPMVPRRDSSVIKGAHACLGRLCTSLACLGHNVSGRPPDSACGEECGLGSPGQPVKTTCISLKSLGLPQTRTRHSNEASSEATCHSISPRRVSVANVCTSGHFSSDDGSQGMLV